MPPSRRRCPSSAGRSSAPPWPRTCSSAGRRWRPPPAGSWARCTSSGCCASHRTARSAGSLTRTSSRCHRTPRWGRGPASSRRTTRSGLRASTRTGTCWVRSRWTTCSTTSCPRTGGRTTTRRSRTSSSPGAVGPPWPGAPVAREPRTRGLRLDQPREARRALISRPQVDPEAFGRLSERFARFMGTARFLVYMTAFIALWLAWNVLAPKPLQFDPYTFTFMTLLLSLQASYAAPLILLAQNRQTDRDRVISEQDRARDERALADTEYLTREVASLRIALREVATRDFVRSELRTLLEELEQRDRLAEPDGDELDAAPPASA